MSRWWGLRFGRRKGLENYAKKNEQQINISSENSKTSSSNSEDSSESGRESGDEFSGFPLLGASDDQGCVQGFLWFTSCSGSNSSVGSSGSPDSPAHVAFHIRGQGEKGSGTISLSVDKGLIGNKLAQGNIFHEKANNGKSEGHRLPLPPGPPSRHSMSYIPRSPRTPETSSNWRKGKFIRKCTSGLLYLGFNSDRGLMCTIKEVTALSDDTLSRKCLNKLNQEKTLLSQLSHANIVQYYGFDLSGRKLSVYLEYISGGSVLQLLEEYGPLGEPIIQSYIQQVIVALVYLHGRDTVHRDIRGENIIVTPNGDVKLVDFGMAKPVVMNTNGYSLAADIWSLGCIVIEMATSKPPWSQYEGDAAVYKIGETKNAPDIPDHLSADAISFIKLCLQQEPSARPTAKQLLNHPFVRTQTSLNLGSTNSTKTREAVPHTINGGNYIQSAPKMKSKLVDNSCLKESRTMNGAFDMPDISIFK